MARIGRVAVPALLLVAAYWAVFGGEYSIWELRKARVELRENRQELADLRSEIDSLKAWADSLRSDPWTLERLAREQHGLVRPGEEVIRVIQGEPGDSSASEPDSAGGR